MEIEFEDFIKVDIRVGTIKSIEPIPKSKKLLKLVVSFGSELGDRVILGGIASAFPDRVKVDQKVLAVVNLKPREMMGVESHGMLLAGKGSEDKLYLMACDMDVADGTRIG